MVSGHAYPYRYLVPRQIDGLLAAGRCASAAYLGFAFGRGMGECMGMGQAAGVAAAVSVKTGIARNVDVTQVQAFLRQWGVHI